MSDHINHSVGGLKGHILRRLIHVSMVFVPIIYYTYGADKTVSQSVSLLGLAGYIVLAILMIEIIRLKFRITIIGQRKYESRQVSAFAWGALAIWVTMLVTNFHPFTAGSGIDAGLYGIPIIFGLAFVDPVMGEMRSLRGTKSAIVAGTIISFIVWIGCHLWLATPLWVSLLLAPLTVIGELPSVKFIDDNATIILLPLGGLLLLSPFL